MFSMYKYRFLSIIARRTVTHTLCSNILDLSTFILIFCDVKSYPVQEQIKTQVANMYLWPKTLEVQILDPSK